MQSHLNRSEEGDQSGGREAARTRPTDAAARLPVLWSGSRSASGEAGCSSSAAESLQLAPVCRCPSHPRPEAGTREPLPLGPHERFSSAGGGGWGEEVCRTFYLQSAARKLVRPDHALQGCLRRPKAYRHRKAEAMKQEERQAEGAPPALPLGPVSIDVLFHPEVQRASYRGLRVCSCVWACPSCAKKITERRRKDLQRALLAYEGRIALLTLTIQHNAGDELKTMLAQLGQARKKLVSGRAAEEFRKAWGIEGTITSLEVTWGEENGWHPHLHALVLFSDPVDIERCQEAFRDRWEACVLKAGLRPVSRIHGATLRAGDDQVGDYVAKFGHEPSEETREKWIRGEGWTVSHELTKAPTKKGREGRYGPFGLLARYADHEDLRAGALFAEYVEVFRYAHQLQWSPGLKARLGLEELTDEQVCERAEERGWLLASLTLEDWKQVLRGDRRGLVLRVAASGDGELLRGLLADLDCPSFIEQPREACEERGYGHGSEDRKGGAAHAPPV